MSNTRPPTAFPRLCALLFALTATCLGLHALRPAAASAATLPVPASDPFYTDSGSLAAVKPGAVLRTRQVTITVEGLLPALTATQVLYRTTNQLGQPDATVATIIKPLLPTGTPKLLSYQTFYDGVASTCRPSYTLQAINPGNVGADLDETFMLDYLTQGYTVVTSDYEGSTDDYGAGRQSGYGTLDAIRAAEHVLGLSAGSTPVGLTGYSGGATASMWAAQDQPTYASELDINGTAAGGIPVDFAHNLDYIDGSSGWAGAIPAVMTGLARAYHVNFGTYLSDKGAQIVAAVSKGCLNPTAYPGLKFSDMLKPQYADWKRVPIFERIFNDSIMAPASAPREPMLLDVGNADGTGDGVMIAKDVQQLADEYCQRGIPTQFNVFTGLNHDAAAVPFEAQASGFFLQRYAGQTPTNGCSAITPGNALTPLPVTAIAKPVPAKKKPAPAKKKPAAKKKHKHARRHVKR